MDKGRSLEGFPVQLFAVVMGLSGLTIAYAKAYHFLEIPAFFYHTLLVLDTVVFFLIFITYMVKWLKYPHAVAKEFKHPVKSSFGAAISISFLLISIAYYDFAPTVAITYWYLGAPLHLYFTYKTMKFWILHEFEINHISPAWFIPVVGNVLVPVVGVDVMPEELSIFYFALGLFFWVVLFTIIIYRMIFHNPMAKRLLPTFFILIAPPAVGFISYMRLTFGSIDFFSLILYFVALFTFFLMVIMAKVFLRLEFFISWWAYTFPMAALTIATMLMYMAYRNSITYASSIVFLLITTVIVGTVAYKTLIAAKKGKICVVEE
ncbi:MAG: C4-dicarboxylate ABC transporter [Aquificae bacterium]|nr:C4-dicarboxylate ABC transporter [Aquificota bacterium]